VGIRAAAVRRISRHCVIVPPIETTDEPGARLPGLKFMRTLWVCNVAGSAAGPKAPSIGLGSETAIEVEEEIGPRAAQRLGNEAYNNGMRRVSVADFFPLLVPRRPQTSGIARPAGPRGMAAEPLDGTEVMRRSPEPVESGGHRAAHRRATSGRPVASLANSTTTGSVRREESLRRPQACAAFRVTASTPANATGRTALKPGLVSRNTWNAARETLALRRKRGRHGGGDDEPDALA
jgi:hypothetical protein